ncbi:hypothetical protein CWI38_1948p0010, partial [Hamiltosporidium tvaerminnensis]
MFEEALLTLAFAIYIPKTTLFDIFKSGKYIKRISSTVKPTLTDKNKMNRLKFCLSKVNLANNRDLLFDDLYDYVHIYEKWFYLTKVKRSYYLMLNDEKPKRNCKSKRFITKIMFMAALALPRYDAHRKLYFDRKIGIWPFVYQEPAQRNSKNRVKGTMITKNVESVTAVHCKNMIMDNVIPAIKSKFPPAYKKKTIYVQQDNAKPHFFDNDADIVALGSADDWNIKYKAQPANSPDLNVLDFASPHTIDELINCVQDAFYQLEANTLDKVFTTLQACMEPIILADGGNGYKIPHLGKGKLRPEGRLLEKYVLSKKHTIKPNQISSPSEMKNSSTEQKTLIYCQTNSSDSFLKELVHLRSNTKTISISKKELHDHLEIQKIISKNKSSLFITGYKSKNNEEILKIGRLYNNEIIESLDCKILSNKKMKDINYHGPIPGVIYGIFFLGINDERLENLFSDIFCQKVKKINREYFNYNLIISKVENNKYVLKLVNINKNLDVIDVGPILEFEIINSFMCDDDVFSGFCDL